MISLEVIESSFLAASSYDACEECTEFTLNFAQWICVIAIDEADRISARPLAPCQLVMYALVTELVYHCTVVF